jgi:hypothetical protein
MLLWTSLQFAEMISGIFWGAYFKVNILVIFPIENSILFSQSTGKKFPIES